MKNYKSILAVLLLLFSFSGDCLSQAKTIQASFAKYLADQPYLGDARSNLYLHGYKKYSTVAGTGSFSLGPVAGNDVTVVLICKLTGGDEFNFAIPGKQNGKGWSSLSKKGSFVIKENGNITGKFQTANQEITWKGMLFADRIMLDVKIKYLIQQDKITAGSIIATHLDLFRSVPTGSKKSQSKGCKTIVWENRSSFNLFSGGVDIIRVPVCHN